MSRCAGCGGVLGRDCWNEADCVWISQDMAARAASQQPGPCQGCSMVAGNYVPCIGVCVGLTCDADVEARAAAWKAMFATAADQATDQEAADVAVGATTGDER